MVDLEAFFPLIRPHAVAAPPPLIEQHVVRAAISYCEATQCWRIVGPLPFDAVGEGAVTLAAPAGASVHEVEGVWFNGRRLDVVPFDEMPMGEATDGDPHTFTQAERGKIVCWPAPSSAASVVVSRILKPSRAAQELPDFLLEDFGDAIADGALADLLAMHETPWMNLTLAAAHASRFQAAKDAGFGANVFGQHSGPARVRSSFF